MAYQLAKASRKARRVLERTVDSVRAFVEEWRTMSRDLNAEIDRYRAERRED